LISLCFDRHVLCSVLRTVEYDGTASCQQNKLIYTIRSLFSWLWNYRTISAG